MPRLRVNAKLGQFLTKPQPIKVAIGGRGSGKSIGFGDMLTFKMLTEQCDIYCLREYQESIDDSVHRVFKGSIQDRLQLQGWSILDQKVISPYGNVTRYKGAARNPDSIQSAEKYKYSWYEEAHKASKNSLDKLLPTILRNPGAQCWFSGNPQSQADPFSERFINPYQKELDRDGYYEDDMHLIVVVNWRDNPWWNEEQERLRRWDFENRPRAEYDWIWEGKFYDHIDGSIIKPEWFDACIDAHKKQPEVFKPHGAIIATHDPFDDGDDAAAYCLRHGSIIKSIQTKENGEIDECCEWALGSARQDKADVFRWDGDGMGAGLKGLIKKELDGTSVRVDMFRGALSGSAQDNALRLYEDGGDSESAKTYADTFSNNRSQYYTRLALCHYNTYRHMERGEYINPDDMISYDSEGIDNLPFYKSQLCRIPRVPNSKGLIQIMDKKSMKKLLKLDSPNESDTVMMSMKFPESQYPRARPLRSTGW